MDTDELTRVEEEMIREIEEYNREKDKIRMMLGKIGGQSFSRVDIIVNAVFLTIILTLFILEITTHFLPSFISLEISVLLVSIKIVLLMHNQYKTNHFQFWVLNSIEFKINTMHTDLRKLKLEVMRENEEKNSNIKEFSDVSK
jgi:predicted signal transduction protein with EAL and GGDEF domain